MNTISRYKSVLFIYGLIAFGVLAALAIVGALAAYSQALPSFANNGPNPYDWQGEGVQNSSQYGEAVRSAGDVNCDGYDDAIVGAMQYDHPGFSDSGIAFVYYGSSSGLSATPVITLNPPTIETNGFFGGMATTAGDVNNDDCDDVMVSMVNYAGNDVGAVYVWHGSDSGLASSPDWKATGGATYAHLGWDLSAAGDTNDDGYDDIIAGALRYDGGNISHAYLWFGSADGLNKGVDGTPANADWSATTDQHCNAAPGCSAFGARVGSPGDVNGDNINDVYVAAPLYDKGQADEGVVFVWHGSKDDGPNDGVAGLPSNADWLAESNITSGQLGTTWNIMVSGVDSAGDVDADGYDDIIVGMNYYNNGQVNEGAAFVWLGSESGLNNDIDGTLANAEWMAESNQAHAQLGLVVSSAGDVNADGYGDVLVGAHAYDITGTTTYTNGGSVMIWHGSGSGLGPNGTPANADWTAGGDQVNGYLGKSVDSLGDVNKDGHDDVIAGATAYDIGAPTDEGAAFAYYGKSLITGLAATSDAPTLIGNTTTFTATVETGSNVTYEWDFGDTLTGTGKVVTHKYEAHGDYDVTVVASNAFSSDLYTFEAAVEPHILYLPVIFKK